MKKTITFIFIVLFILVCLSPIVTIAIQAFSALLTDSTPIMKEWAQPVRQLRLLSRSVTVAAATAFFSLLTGGALGYIVARFRIRFKRFWTVIFLTPLILPLHLYALSWIQAAGRAGWLTELLGLNSPLFPIYSLPGVVFTLSCGYFPIAFLATLIGFKAIERDLEDAGRLVFKERDVFLRITLPLITPYLAAAGALIVILALNEHGVPSLLQVNLLSSEIFTRFNALFNPSLAAVDSMMLLALTTLIVLITYNYLAKRRYLSITGKAGGGRQIGRRKTIAAAYVLLFVLLILTIVIPLVTLVRNAAALNALQTSFISAQRQIVCSLRISVYTTLATTTIGFFVAHWIQERTSFARKTLNVGSLCIFAVPSMVIGIGVIQLWNRGGAMGAIYQSGGIVVIGLLTHLLPVAIQGMLASMREVSPALEEAAQVCGMGYLRRLVRVVLPLNLRGVFFSAALVFLFSMNALNIPVLLSPPGNATLSIRLFTLLHYAPDSLIAALGIWQVLIVIAGLGILSALFFLFNRIIHVHPSTTSQ